MIERLYIDNFRCFVNCTINFQRTTLLVGPNGTGKSTVFDVANKLKQFVADAGPASDIFSPSDLTSWQQLDDQKFELDLRSNAGVYRYVLAVQHAADRRRCRVVNESLTLQDKPLFSFSEGQLQLYNDRHEAGPSFTFDWNRSGLATIYARPDNTKLTEFKQRLASILFARPCPPMMSGDSLEETEVLAEHSENFASWYRFVQRQDISRQLDLFRELEQTIEGFHSMKLEGPADSTVTMRVAFKSGGGKPSSFRFNQLSDGQKQLIVLYTLSHGLADENRILFLDEPDNYVALREVQPWLTGLIDAAGRSIEQAILVSHHPEVIDQLAPEKGVWLRREGLGPTRVSTGLAKDTAPLRPSEVEARGW